jgi:hypothetical protein
MFASLKECGVTALRNSYVRISLAEDSILLAGLEDIKTVPPI